MGWIDHILNIENRQKHIIFLSWWLQSTWNNNNNDSNDNMKRSKIRNHFLKGMGMIKTYTQLLFVNRSWKSWSLEVNQIPWPLETFHQPLKKTCEQTNTGSFIPIGSMYGIFTYMFQKNQPNVGKYAIHGSYGIIQQALFKIQSKFEVQPKKCGYLPKSLEPREKLHNLKLLKNWTDPQSWAYSDSSSKVQLIQDFSVRNITERNGWFGICSPK